MKEFDTNITMSYYIYLELIFEFFFAQYPFEVIHVLMWITRIYKIHMTEHDVTMTKQILLQFRIQAYIIIPASVGSRRVKI